MTPGRLLLLVFIVFITVSIGWIWLDKKMGWEHERVVESTRTSV
jgi:hypothetical protein